MMPPRAAIQPVDDIDIDDLTHAPKSAMERYWNLFARKEAAFDALSGSFTRVMEARGDMNRAEQEVRELEDAADRGTLMRHATADEAPAISMRDDARLTAARKRAEATRDRHTRAKEQHAALAEQLRIFGGLAQKAERYLIGTRGTKLKAATAPTPTDLKRGESIAEALDGVRAEIERLKRETRSLARGPGSIGEAKSAMREVVSKLAEKGRPDVSPLFRAMTEPRIGWPRWSTGLTVAHEYVAKIDGSALLFWLHEDELVAALDQEIDRHGSGIGEEMLPAADRADRLTAIAQATLDLNYREQALLDRAASDGSTILPRADADIRAVLMLAADSPSPDQLND